MLKVRAHIRDVLTELTAIRQERFECVGVAELRKPHLGPPLDLLSQLKGSPVQSAETNTAGKQAEPSLLIRACVREDCTLTGPIVSSTSALPPSQRDGPCARACQEARVSPQVRL